MRRQDSHWQKPTTSIRPSLSLLAGGLCLLGTVGRAEMAITQLVEDGHGRDVTAGATTPVRVAATAKRVQFHFTEANRKGEPTTRLRYKLEGYDDTWRDLIQERGMNVSLQFWDNESPEKRLVLGGNVFYLSGETPGWRGSAEKSDFTNRSETVTAPERAGFVKIIFLSDGYLPAIGLVAVDAVHLRVEHPADGGRVDQYDLSVIQAADRNDSMGSSVNWGRWGSLQEMAQLCIRPDPSPHPILVLNDTSTRYFAAWVTPEKRNPVPVHPEDRLTLSWQIAHSIGGCGPAQADYPQLLPGNYRFRVAAAKANGELTGAEVSLPIVVVVPVFHRWEFWLTLVLLAGGAAGWSGQFIVRRRMQQRLAEIQRQQALERERSRIARDLHDDIGAGLTEIAMQSDWVRRDLAQGATADTQRRIARVCQSAIELTRSVDEIVWAVNPANDTLDRFANYLTQSAKLFLDAAGLRVRFDIPPELPSTALAGKTRHCLFLAVREALNNVTKHAHADLVRIELRVDAAGLHIAVEDNGGGFTSADTGATGTHEGLESMRRRMEEIAGQFRLTSLPGKGTRAEFLLPFPKTN